MGQCCPAPLPLATHGLCQTAVCFTSLPSCDFTSLKVNPVISLEWEQQKIPGTQQRAPLCGPCPPLTPGQLFAACPRVLPSVRPSDYCRKSRIRKSAWITLCNS